MVRLTSMLSRVPVIKFRKGGVGQSAAAAAAPTGSCPVAQAPAAASQSQGMSTSAIPDIDLPARYRRRPLSEEEIAHINGGGIV